MDLNDHLQIHLLNTLGSSLVFRAVQTEKIAFANSIFINQLIKVYIEYDNENCHNTTEVNIFNSSLVRCSLSKSQALIVGICI